MLREGIHVANQVVRGGFRRIFAAEARFLRFQSLGTKKPASPLFFPSVSPTHTSPSFLLPKTVDEWDVDHEHDRNCSTINGSFA
jgi:hypothetical protein